MRHLNKVIVIFIFSLLSIAVSADDVAIRKSLAQLTPPIKPDTINSTPIDDLFEIMVGPNIFYISGNGKYVIQGNILDVATKTDLTELKLGGLRAKMIAEIDEANTVVFAPEKVKHNIYVFTDIDCAYCRKLHSQIDQYMVQGIKVQYLLFPRAGVGSPSYDKAVTVWCSDDKAAALTESKKGVTLDKKTCKNPVIDHMKLGRDLGLSGTPMMVTNKGTIFPGYMTAQQLVARLKNEP
jgi:thiol:disulfide interchange protein DsbC